MLIYMIHEKQMSPQTFHPQHFCLSVIWIIVFGIILNTFFLYRWTHKLCHLALTLISLLMYLGNTYCHYQNILYLQDILGHYQYLPLYKREYLNYRRKAQNPMLCSELGFYLNRSDRNLSL